MGGKVTNPRRRRKEKPIAPTTEDGKEVRVLENHDPERAGEIMAELMLNPMENLQKLADAAGLPRGIVMGIRRRMAGRNLGLQLELKGMANEELSDLLDDRLRRMLLYLSDDIMAGASMRDLVYGIDRLLNARQLVRGLPTAILSVDDRNQLNRLMPLLVKEAQRRGVELEGEFTVEHG